MARRGTAWQDVAGEAELHVGQLNHFEAGRRPVSELEALRLLRAIVATGEEHERNAV